MSNLMTIYSYYKITLGGLITLTLICSSAVSIYLLKKYFSDYFNTKIVEMLTVLTVFLLSYSFSMVFDILVQLKFRHSEFFTPYTEALLKVTMPVLQDILPLFSVYLLHSKNYAKQIEEESEQSEKALSAHENS